MSYSFFNDFLITELFWDLMKEKKFFVFFPKQELVLFEDDYNKWTSKNSLTSNVERYIFKHITDKNKRSGYCIHCTSYATDLMLPDEVIAKHSKECTVKSLMNE